MNNYETKWCQAYLEWLNYLETLPINEAIMEKTIMRVALGHLPAKSQILAKIKKDLELEDNKK